MAKMIEPQKNTFFHQASVASLSSVGCALSPPLRLVAGRRSPLPPPSCTVLGLTLPSVADGAQAVPPAKPCSCWRSDAPPTPEMAYSSSKTPPAPGRPRVVIAWDPPELSSPSLYLRKDYTYTVPNF